MSSPTIQLLLVLMSAMLVLRCRAWMLSELKKSTVGAASSSVELEEVLDWGLGEYDLADIKIKLSKHSTVVSKKSLT